ncbi:MAG: hypothetical protein JRN47_00440 [Nitrososphaerota archaeon]|nr:hypothetical protein [Nitrososphaerota archaeon]
MSPEGRTLRDYLSELEKTKAGKDQQVKEGLEIFIGLWKRALEKGVVAESDTIDAALSKIEEVGGLYQVAGD